MKNLNQYIYESSFKLDGDERMALAEFIGYITGEYEDEDKTFTNIKVDEKDKKDLEMLFDYLNDDVTYKKITKSGLKGDVKVLQKYLKMAFDDSDLQGYYDLENAYDKIMEL